MVLVEVGCVGGDCLAYGGAFDGSYDERAAAFFTLEPVVFRVEVFLQLLGYAGVVVIVA